MVCSKLVGGEPILPIPALELYLLYLSCSFEPFKNVVGFDSFPYVLIRERRFRSCEGSCSRVPHSSLLRVVTFAEGEDRTQHCINPGSSTTSNAMSCVSSSSYDYSGGSSCKYFALT